MNTTASAPESSIFDPAAYTSLDVHAIGLDIDVESPDGVSVHVSARSNGGKPLGVENYGWTCMRRLSGERRVGPFASHRVEPSADMLHVARRAVAAYLKAIASGAVQEGSYRMILLPGVTPRIEESEWRIVPSFTRLSYAAMAIVDGQVASGDVESSGPETDMVRALRESGRLIAFRTHAHAAADADEYLCRVDGVSRRDMDLLRLNAELFGGSEPAFVDDHVAVVRGLTGAYAVLAAPVLMRPAGPINALWPIVGRETAHGPTTTIIRATDAELARGLVALPDGSFASLSGHYLEGEGASDGTWAEVCGHYAYL